MKKLYRTLPLWIGLWMLVALYSPGRAQESAAPPAAPIVVREQPLFDGSVFDFVKVFGLGGMIFVIWLFDYRRQRGLEEIIKQYDVTQQAHLAAFKDINDRNMATFREAMVAMQKVSEDAQGTAVLCAQVNTRVAERLDYLSKERPA